jgi:hypothetical protein
MKLKRVIALVMAAGLAGVFAGRAEVMPAAGTVAQIHWLGLKQISADSDAAHFLSIWNLPETAAWEAQALEKISRVPWTRFHGADISKPNPASVLLRPLLDDVVQAESYAEVRGADNAQPGQMAFAIRLSDARAQLWQTNLQAALALLTEIQPVAGKQGWSLKKHESPDLIEFTRAGGWTVLGAATGTNALFADFVARIGRDHAPFPKAAANNPWLSVDADVAPTLRALSRNWNPPFQLPRFSLTVAGDGRYVRTLGKVDFARALDLQMEPWHLPTNLVCQPVQSFTAVRGIAPWLASQKAWNDLQIGPPPNEWFSESISGFWSPTFVAAWMPDASNRVSQIASQLVDRGTPWLATNGMGRFHRAAQFNGVTWGNVPFVAPDLRVASGTDDDFIVGEMFPTGTSTNHPQEMFKAILGQPNLVYYNWELTGPCLQAQLRTTQLFRMFFHKPQLSGSSPGLKWFVAAVSKLFETVTTVEEISPTQFSLNRRSDIGLTAFELHVLADWIESPVFPAGLYTFTAPPPQQVPAALPPSPAR